MEVFNRRPNDCGNGPSFRAYPYHLLLWYDRVPQSLCNAVVAQWPLKCAT